MSCLGCSRKGFRSDPGLGGLLEVVPCTPLPAYDLEVLRPPGHVVLGDDAEAPRVELHRDVRLLEPDSAGSTTPVRACYGLEQS